MAIITKVEDNAFEGNHPNNINTGFTISIDEIVPELPVMGESYRFGRLITSYVTAIMSITDERYVFKTKNSTYKIEL
jgi:hypothetical protein